jgi:hypothetical protein
MAITGSQLDDLPDLTDAQMLRAVKQAIAQVLLAGQAYSSVLQKGFTRADLGALQRMEAAYQNRVAAASSNTGDLTALADFGGC